MRGRMLVKPAGAALDNYPLAKDEKSHNTTPQKGNAYE
jgi:hypothetical protein